MHEAIEEKLNGLPHDLEELKKLSPEELWDLIGHDAAQQEALRKQQEVRMVCAQHQKSLGDRMERTAWNAYAKRHGLDANQRPAYMNLPQRVKPKGFG